MRRHDDLLRDNRLALRQLTRSRRGGWLLALLLGLVTLFAMIGLLALSGWFISAAAFAGLVSLTMAFSFNYFTPATVIRFFAIVRTAGRYGERLASHHAVLALLADLRSVLFARLLRSRTAGLRLHSMRQMHRLTSDVDTLNEWPLAMLLPWAWALLLSACYAVLLAWVSPLLLLWVLPPLLFAVVLIPAWVSYRSLAVARQQADANEARRSALLNPLSALTALLQWSRWTDFAREFVTLDHEHGANQCRLQRLISAFTFAQQVALLVALAILLWRGTYLLTEGALSVPLLLALLLALLGLGEVLLPLTAKAPALGQSFAARDRLNHLLTEISTPTPSPQPLPQASWQIVADNISARQRQALTGPDYVHFSLQQGDVMVVMGGSGGGKSTLLDVLAGELPLLDGRLTLNGQPWDTWDWQGSIAYLAQQWMIFDLTLAQNLRLGLAKASEAQLWQVLEMVELADWVRAQPAGLHTPLGEYGAAVSGGQARRIALARLLLKPYPLMLLDEPFAGLDVAMRQRLYDKLRLHQYHGILIIVSHHELDWGTSTQMLQV